MRSILRVLLLSLLLLMRASAAPAPSLPRLAVLEFNMSGEVVSDEFLETLNSAFRGGVVEAVEGRYDVMSKQTMLELLPPDAAQCSALLQQCSAKIGQQLQASHVVAGRLSLVDGLLLLSLDAFETVSGRQLGSEQLRATKSLELLDKLKREGPGLVRRWLKVAATSAPITEVAASSVRSAELATLLVTCDVEGAEVSIDGRPQGVKAGRKELSFSLPPGRRQIKVSRSGYLDETRTVDLTAGARVSLAAHLEQERAASTTPVTEDAALTFLTVTSEPKGAVIALDGRKLGKTPRTLEVTPGAHRVSLSLEWYAETSADVTVAEGTTQKVSLVLPPDFAELKVSTTPAGATVFLDGKQVGTAEPTLSLPRVTVGRHTLKAIKADHHDVEQSIEVKAGEKKAVTLPPLKPSVGALRIVTDKSGASVEVDGRSVGRTPITVERLADGPHAVKVLLDEHDDWEGSASVVEGQTRELSVSLESLMATVQVTSTPAGQAVAVDGREAGKTPLTVSMREGEHQLRVGTPKTAFAVREERLTVARGQKRTVSWTLEPLFGRLVVMSEPPEAMILLDGKELGTAPQVVARAPAGEHKVTARATGMNASSQTVLLQPGKEARVTIKLSSGVFEAAGREWQAEPAPREMNWADAMAYCRKLTLADGRWRLPSKEELVALYVAKDSVRGVEGVSGMDYGSYWSSTHVSDNTNYAWLVFNDGTTYDGIGVSGPSRVRCVR